MSRRRSYARLRESHRVLPCTIQVYGLGFKQRRNDLLITRDIVGAKVVTKKNALSSDAVRDLVLASIAIK